MFDRLLSLVMAVCLAGLVWLYARSREQDTLDNVPITVDMQLTARQADNYLLETTGPRQVLVTFTAPPHRMRELHLMLQRKELHIVKTITVPDERLNESRFSESLVVDASDLNTPLGINAFFSEGRNRIPYTLHRIIERRLPVRFVPLSEGPTGPIILEPATVLVRGPREVLDRVQHINTQPSELPTRPMHAPEGVPAIGRVSIAEDIESRPIRATPGHIMVKVPGQARKLYELTDVPINFLCPANFHLRPKFIDERAGKVSLKVLGPVREEPPRVYAFVDLTRGKFLSGLNHEELHIQLPREFQLTQNPPRVVAFELLPGDFAPDGLGMPAPTTSGARE